LLLAYGQSKTSITRLQKGDYKLENQPDAVLWKKKLYFKQVTEGDLHTLIHNVQNNPDVTRHHPRFIIFTNFKTLLAVDTKMVIRWIHRFRSYIGILTFSYPERGWKNCRFSVKI
jgi:hypothetical protein